MEKFYIVWNFEYALIPCLVAYLVFEIPILVRRFTRKLYVPIYFAFFPFGYSDELYARYFDEDHMYTVGGPFTQDERSNAQIKIIWVSVLSLILTMAISPFISALFGYYFLSSEQFMQFFWTLALIKAVLLLISLYDLRWKYRITEVVPISYIALVYLVYWGVILIFLDRSYDWISIQIDQGGVSLLAENIIDFIVFEIGIGIIFVAILGWLIPWRITRAYINEASLEYQSEYIDDEPHE